MESSVENTIDLKKSSYNPEYYMKWYNDNKEKRKEIMHTYYLKKKEQILQRNTSQ